MFTDLRNSDSFEAALVDFRTQGWCTFPNILSDERRKEVLACLWESVDESERRGLPTRMGHLDPNEHNIRVFYLCELDKIFLELIEEPTAVGMAKTLFGDNFLVNNFSANIARPGSKAMGLHSDQSLIAPGPWIEPWSLNVIWCLQDTNFENGATRFIPGSQKWKNTDDIPEEPEKLLQAFEAKAGSIVCMDGRVWHTSGSNISKDSDRALLFAHYTVPFLRGQVNWAASLSKEQIGSLSPQMKEWMGVNRDGNLGVVKGVNKVF